MAQVKVKTQDNQCEFALFFLSSILILFLLLFAPPLHAQEKIIKSHGISAFGELKYPADFKHWDYVNPDAPQGGTISFLGTGASGTFDSLNPFILKGEPAQGIFLMHDSLLVLSRGPHPTARPADEPDSAYAYLAESLEYPENRQWVIFNMRPEATFSDGHPITAEDVVFTYNILLEKGHPIYKIGLKDFETVEALGPHRVKFTFKDGADTRDLPASAGLISILPKHYYETHDFAKSGTDEIPVVSGGYLPTEISPGRSIKYCKIPNYWAKDLPHNRGVRNFDCYVYEYFADRTVAFEAFKGGEVLFHEEFSSKIWATDYEFPALKKGWVVKETIPDNSLSGTQGFWFNLRREKFSDPRVRQAIGMVFNFEWTNKTLFYGQYKRTDSFWENSTMEASGLPEGAELALLEEYRGVLPESVFTEPAFTPIKSRPDRADRKALRQAGKLLDAAGWKIIDGKRLNNKGEVLTIEYLDDGPGSEKIVNPFIENLNRLGIEAEFKQVDKAQMQERQKNFDYDFISGRLVMSSTPGEELETIFGTDGAKTPGSANFSGLSHPAVDGLIATISQAQNREEMEIAARALDRVLRSLHIWVPQWNLPAHRIAYWDVFGRPDVKPLYARGVIESWWIEQDKFKKLTAEGALR